jgi:aspartyl-tRNA(Asn)/glutamyl-tRNA(Gln) amidotransferase subunit A
VGVPRAPFFTQLHPDVHRAMEGALNVLRRLTARMDDVVLPPAPVLLIGGAEAHAFHAPSLARSPELYQPSVRRMLERGGGVSAEAYARALRDLARVRRDIRQTFAAVDVLVLPTVPEPPFEVEAGTTRDVSPRNTAVFDAFGIPVISLPCGFTGPGLPIGMQIGGAPWAEPTVLALAHAYQQATPWHRRKPPL